MIFRSTKKRCASISFVAVIEMNLIRKFVGSTENRRLTVIPSRLGGFTKYWSVSSAGRQTGGIDFQTNVDWISTKMNDAQQVSRDTCTLRFAITRVLFAFMYSTVRAFALQRDSTRHTRHSPGMLSLVSRAPASATD